MRKTSLARRRDSGKWEMLEDRVDIDSEYFVTKRTHESVLVFAQEPREDEDGTAFKAVEDPAPGLHGDSAPGL